MALLRASSAVSGVAFRRRLRLKVSGYDHMVLIVEGHSWSGAVFCRNEAHRHAASLQ